MVLKTITIYNFSTKCSDAKCHIKRKKEFRGNIHFDKKIRHWNLSKKKFNNLLRRSFSICSIVLSIRLSVTDWSICKFILLRIFSSISICICYIQFRWFLLCSHCHNLKILNMLVSQLQFPINKSFAIVIFSTIEHNVKRVAYL